MATGALGDVLGWFVGLSGFGAALFAWGKASNKIKKTDVVSPDSCATTHKILEQRLERGNQRFESGEAQFKELRANLCYIRYLLQEITTDDQQSKAEKKMDRFEGGKDAS